MDRRLSGILTIGIRACRSCSWVAAFTRTLDRLSASYGDGTIGILGSDRRREEIGDRTARALDLEVEEARPDARPSRRRGLPIGHAGVVEVRWPMPSSISRRLTRHRRRRRLRLLINASAPVFVIIDGHPTHRAKSGARFVAAQAGKLALFLLPPYSPELNPRRAGVERSEVPRHRSETDHLADAVAPDGRLPYAAIAKAAGAGALLLPRSNHPLRTRLMATIMGRLITG